MSAKQRGAVVSAVAVAGIFVAASLAVVGIVGEPAFAVAGAVVMFATILIALAI